jgi:hypothetical protein
MSRLSASILRKTSDRSSQPVIVARRRKRSAKHVLSRLSSQFPVPRCCARRNFAPSSYQS